MHVLFVAGKTRTKDKYRVVYSDHQRLELEKEFHYSRYITIRRKSELAATLGLSERQVSQNPSSYITRDGAPLVGFQLSWTVNLTPCMIKDKILVYFFSWWYYTIQYCFITRFIVKMQSINLSINFNNVNAIKYRRHWWLEL